MMLQPDRIMFWMMEIPDWKMEAAEDSDNEVSIEKSRHYRLGPDNLDDTLVYDPEPCEKTVPEYEEKGSPGAAE